MKSFVFVNLICCISIMIDLIHLNKVFLMPTIISTTVEMVVSLLWTPPNPLSQEMELLGDVFCSKQRKNALSSQCHCHSKSLTLECAMHTVHQWHFPHRANNRQIGLSALVNLQLLQPDLDQYSNLFIRGNSTSSRVIYFNCRLKHFNTMQKVPADWFISIAGPVKLFSGVTAS